MNDSLYPSFLWVHLPIQLFYYLFRLLPINIVLEFLSVVYLFLDTFELKFQVFWPLLYSLCKFRKQTLINLVYLLFLNFVSVSKSFITPVGLPSLSAHQLLHLHFLTLLSSSRLHYWFHPLLAVFVLPFQH